MKLKSHSESHIRRFALADLPGRLDLTLNWKPETELMVAVFRRRDQLHMLVGDGVKVHVIATRRKLARQGGEVRPQRRLGGSH